MTWREIAAASVLASVGVSAVVAGVAYRKVRKSFRGAFRHVVR